MPESELSMTARPGAVRTVALTCLALVAFAANSVLCRLALGEGRIDAPSFTTVRLLAGVLALLLIVAAREVSRRADSAFGRRIVDRPSRLPGDSVE